MFTFFLQCMGVFSVFSLYIFGGMGVCFAFFVALCIDECWRDLYVSSYFLSLLIQVGNCPKWCFQTYTGNILIAVNPFRKLPHLYGSHMMAQYKGAAFGELSPHPFAVADAAYRYPVVQTRSCSF